jgi:hypothetical protein
LQAYNNHGSESKQMRENIRFGSRMKGGSRLFIDEDDVTEKTKNNSNQSLGEEKS